MRMVRVAVILGALLAGCSEPPTNCDPSTCAGCCSSNGTCEVGDQHAACGVKGSQCSACSGAERCQAAVCVVVSIVDAGSMEASVVDAGLVDAGVVDAGSVDAGVVDAGVVDAGVVDAGFADAGVADAGAVDAGQLRGRLWMIGRIGPSVSQVYVQDPVGSLERTVSAPGRTATGMAVSDDGAMIAISYEGSPAELFVGPTDGGPAQLVRSSTGSLRVFAISPDHGSVVFMEKFGWDDGAMLLTLDGGSAVQATPRSTNFISVGSCGFSPNSRYFASCGSTNSGWADVYLTDTVTGAMSPVPSPPNADIMALAWISDASFMFVAFGSSGTVPSLHLCAVPGSCAPLSAFAGARTLHVSRDRTLAVVGLDAVDGGLGLALLRVPLDGGAPTPIATGFRTSGLFTPTALSPDGERLTAMLFQPPLRAIYALPTSGSSLPTPLLTLPDGVGAELPVFDPDSTQVVFRSNLEGFGSASPDGWGLQRLDLTTPGQPPILTQRADGGMIWDFAWTP